MPPGSLSAVVHKTFAKTLARVWVIAAALGWSASLRAAEVTRVVSALDDENRFDFNATVAWLHESRNSFIKREDSGQLFKDLEYARRRDIIDMRLDFGILWDVGLHVSLPYVWRDDRTLSFDTSAGSGCILPGTASDLDPTCVNSKNSTILRDGILPGYEQNEWGLDAKTGRPFSAARMETGVFRGPTRSGFESLNVGLTWAAFNQMRDDTRPTWTLSFDAKLDVFKDMRFDRDNPKANTAVGLGYHQFVWSTFVSKRFRHFDPYFGAWYMLPVRTNHSIFADAPNQTTVNPQQRAGFMLGVEQVAWENPRARQRVTVEARLRVDEHFHGRSASEIWEPLAGSQSCPTVPAACRAGIDANVDDAPKGPHPGVTETQAYASFGGDVGLNVQVGKYVRFRGLFGTQWDTAHFITYAATGVDRNMSGGVDLRDPGEANGNFRDALDAPGRRFLVDGSQFLQIWSAFFEGSIMF